MTLITTVLFVSGIVIVIIVVTSSAATTHPNVTAIPLALNPIP